MHHDSGDTLARDESHELISAEKVKGTSVYDQTGEKIGSIDSVMLGKRDGRVAYAIMSFGGFLGIGEKYHALPWNALDYDTSVGGYRLAAGTDTLRDAPAFERSVFDREDRLWGVESDSYWSRPGLLAEREAGRY
jgi:sporulation protein YlmC with PRC-barrel domain